MEVDLDAVVEEVYSEVVEAFDHQEDSVVDHVVEDSAVEADEVANRIKYIKNFQFESSFFLIETNLLTTVHIVYILCMCSKHS